MKYLNIFIGLVILTALVALPASAISIRSLLGLDEEEEKTEEIIEAKPAAKAKSTNWSTASPSVATGAIDLSLIKRLIANLDAQQKTALLADEATFAKFIRQEANNISVISAARANKLEEDANTTFLMQRGAGNILREVYLTKLIREKLPKGFPNEQQVQEYYDKNQDNFVIGKRIHVWQIFFPITDGMDEKAISALRKKANQVASLITSKKINFNDAAIKYSKHAQSNANGGYMGLIKAADLKPDIQKQVMALPQGETSSALTTDTGIHVIKRGAILPERKITLTEGKAQIQKLLVNQVNTQLRKAIFEQAAKTYAVEVTDNKIEEWRLRLKTNMDSPAAK